MEQETAEPQDARQRLVTHVTTLLNTGAITPKQAGEILSSGMSYPNMNLGGGASMEDMLTLLKFVTENRGSPELDKMSMKLEQLEEKLKEKGNKGETVPYKPPTPVEQLTQTRELLTTVRELAGEMGLVVPSNNRGEVDQKAKWEHEERMEEIKIKSEHQKGMRNLAESIPEKIGRGLARHIRESGGEAEEGTMEEGGIESFPCSTCHAKVFVPPNAGNILWCGSCGAKYQKGEQVAPASSPANK